MMNLLRTSYIELGFDSMKILYDYQIFTFQHYGGISRYFCELINQYSRIRQYHFNLQCVTRKMNICTGSLGLNRFWTQRNDFFSDSQFFVRLQKKIHVICPESCFR